MQAVQDVKGSLLEDDLQRRRDRFVPRRERLVGASRRSEQRFERRREHAAERRLAVVPRHAGAVGPVAEVREVQLEAPAGQQPNSWRISSTNSGSPYGARPITLNSSP